MLIEHTVVPVRAPRTGSAARAAIILLMTFGLAFRVAPLFNQGGRLLRQFPTEDGYLMLTIARNIAIGNGMSTAAGTIPTNGTQPGITFLWAVCYRLVGGDKVLGVALVQVVEIAIGLLGAFALYRLARLLLAGHPDGTSMAALTAALWYAAPLTVAHCQNCLETGAYATAVLLVLSAYLSAWRAPGECWSFGRCLGLGLLFGVCFWIRNDAVLLIFAACVVRVLSGLQGGKRLLARRIYESILVGLTALCAAMPWLAYSLVRFGHIVPISGRSEAMDGVFAGNLRAVAPKLAEYILIVGAIPSQLEQKPLVLGACVLVVAVFAGVSLGMWWRADPALRMTFGVVAVFAVLVALFYGLYFGAGHFMSRYLFPLSPFLALTSLTALWELCRLLGRSRWRAVVVVAGSAAAASILLALDLRLYVKGKAHMHFQVVEWVDQNVPEEAWVAAPQTGTLGYFHDRTINLDGKVNPEALLARGMNGSPNSIPQYLVNKKVQYLVDWAGLAAWINLPVIHQHFRLVLQDPGRGENGLAVFQRRWELPGHS